jgi:putative membrane protein
MTVVAGVLAALAGLVHVYIFVLESLRWIHPSTRRAFGTTVESAAATAPMAYNQGFYNLFLAVGALLGAVLLGPADTVGTTLVVFACGSMLGAALVLVTSDRTRARAASVQGLFPLLAPVVLGASAL